MTGQISNADFERMRERYYVASVRAAVEEAYFDAAWKPETEAQSALVRALERHGIEPDGEAVRRGADLISRGRKPSVLTTIV